MRPGDEATYAVLVNNLLTRVSEGNLLTDVNPGSVVRTLVEAFARELATAYARLAEIYDLGYIDTASGVALDKLVALVGAERFRALVVGRAVFCRDPARQTVPLPVPIPEGTPLLVERARSRPLLEFRTTAPSQLAAEQVTVTVPIMASLEDGQGQPSDYVLDEDALAAAHVTLAAALPGVTTVTLKPTALRRADETDAELRKRVAGLLAAATAGTARTIEAAVWKTGVAGVRCKDSETPGEVIVYYEPRAIPGDRQDEAGLQQKVEEAVSKAKPPGIKCTVKEQQKQKMQVSLQVKPEQRGLDASAAFKLRQAIAEKVLGYFDALPMGTEPSPEKLSALVMAVTGVAEAQATVKKVEEPGPPPSAPMPAPQPGPEPVPMPVPMPPPMPVPPPLGYVLNERNLTIAIGNP